MFGNQNMQKISNKTIKLILAIGLVVAALVASAGVFYYYESLFQILNNRSWI
jgi:hypothetical protein